MFYLKKTISFILIFILSCPLVYAQDDVRANIGIQIAAEAALWLGTPYGYADGEEGYGSEVDCSGLVMQVYKKFGVELPRNSALQAMEGELIPLDEMIAGDIVCFLYEDGEIGHVGIFDGGNPMIHYTRPEKCVEFSSYFEDWGSIKAVYGRRIEVDSDYIPQPLDEETQDKLRDILLTPNKVKTSHLEGIDYLPVDITVPRTVVLQIESPFMTVNGEQKPIDEDVSVSPFITNGRTHLPLRKVAEEFGAKVNWIGGENGEINLTYGDREIVLWIGADYAISNGTTYYLDSAPMLVNGKTYLPIRFIADEFGWNLIWNENEKTVTLSNQTKIEF